MNTTKIISASGAIAMTAMLFSGIAAMADRDVSPMGDFIAVAAPSATASAAPSATLPASTSAATLADRPAITVAADAPVRQSTLDNATINKWNRLNKAEDSRTMFG